MPLPVADIGEDLSLWGPYPPEKGSGYLGLSDGLSPVLTCHGGFFTESGVRAAIAFRPHTVVWHGFRLVRRSEPTPFEYFVFDRSQYEEARRAFVDGGMP